MISPSGTGSSGT